MLGSIDFSWYRGIDRHGGRSGSVIDRRSLPLMIAHTSCGPTAESGAPSAGPVNKNPSDGTRTTLTHTDSSRERDRDPSKPKSPAIPSSHPASLAVR